jgi:hypothetical protein
MRKKNKNHREMKTVSFAHPTDLMKDVKRDLKEAGYIIKEEGSPKSSEGHCIEAFLDDGEQVMWAMIHSGQQHYILRAIDGLFSPA